MKALIRRSQPSNSSSSPNSTSSSSTSSSTSSSLYSWVQLRSVLLVVSSSSPAHCSSSSSDRVRLKSPWSRRKRKLALSLNQWRQFFTLDGGLRDGGVKLMKRVRSGGVDPSIRAEVWPFLLGVYDLNSSKDERDIVRDQKRKEYEKLRRECRQVMMCLDGSSKLIGDSCPDIDSPSSEDVVTARESISSEQRIADSEYSDNLFTVLLNEDDTSRQKTNADSKALNSDSSDSDSSVESEVIQSCPSYEANKKSDHDMSTKDDASPLRTQVQSTRTSENFSTWRRIIRLDAVRTNADWIPYSPTQAEVLNDRARQSAESVGLKDYDHLEPCRVFHAARLVAILEAYALYDPEIGYCQGMSDLLSPIAAVMTEDHDAFWCFVGFMKKARHNFRLDEVGIRRQLHIVSKIIRCKDSHLYRHLEQLQAEDCFFVYRMVVVLFRRELTFDQTICLWEVMWADQAAVRAGIGKSAWSRIRQRAPPTEDLLLYAIAASVLQKRKLIIEKYSSMDEILRECNGMCGQLDIWKLLDDAHDLVVNLHDKIETSISEPSLS